jgi:hypothetical protein
VGKFFDSLLCLGVEPSHNKTLYHSREGFEKFAPSVAHTPIFELT